MIKVTDISIKTIKDQKNIKAYAKVVINESLCIDGIKIIDGQNGLFIGMPSKKKKDGNFADIVFPINADTRKILTDAILEEYKKADAPFD